VCHSFKYIISCMYSIILANATFKCGYSREPYARLLSRYSTVFQHPVLTSFKVTSISSQDAVECKLFESYVHNILDKQNGRIDGLSKDYEGFRMFLPSKCTFLNVCLSVCLAVCLSACLSLCMSIAMYVCLSVYWYFCLSVYLSYFL
jgi:hypothetical protein